MRGAASCAPLSDVVHRYFSILCITISNIGSFGAFSKEACDRFYLVAPAFKGALARCLSPFGAHWRAVVQTVICQAILSVRCATCPSRIVLLLTLRGQDVVRGPYLPRAPRSLMHAQRHIQAGAVGRVSARSDVRVLHGRAFFPQRALRAGSKNDQAEAFVSIFARVREYSPRTVAAHTKRPSKLTTRPYAPFPPTSHRRQLKLRRAYLQGQ